ncbi:MAG TPA: hypothetical protein VH040_15750 [Usitatibacter sp.]|jgi:hypothetical protein|nr:hypothetical protein [Usitatibacter sp.]
MAFWQSRFALPVEERTGVAPPELVQFLALDVINQGIPAEPRAATAHAGVLAEVRAVLAELPQSVKRRLSERLAGIYLAEDFGGTGFTDTIADDSGRKVAAFVVLDPNVLEKRTANEWGTWKESSPFTPDPRYALREKLEDAAHDNRRQAIQYILLHELGHVLSVGGHFHPDWNFTPSQVPPGESDPFFDLSWTLDRAKNEYVSKYAETLPEAKQVRYYFGARLAPTDMARTYEHLEHTPFPTLYATTHPGDDFAEAFANYVHVVMLGKPFEITIVEDGKIVKRYGPCWDEPRCAEKRKILEEFLR